MQNALWKIVMNDERRDMGKPLISVIVPVYKVEKYLNRCLASIVGQSYDNLEIILVDDGSPDHCPDLCDTWAKKDTRIKVIHKKNGGLSDARNVGIKISTGELIGFVDSDDWIAKDMYQRLYEAMKKNSSDIAACGVEMLWEDGRKSQLLTTNEYCILDQKEAMEALIEKSWLKDPVWYKLYKSALIHDTQFPVGKYHEDVFWSYQAIGKAKSITVIPYIGYYYWQRQGSIMGESYSFKRLDAVEALESRQYYLENRFPDLAIKGRCDLWFSCMYHVQKVLKYLPIKEQSDAIQNIRSIMQRHPFSSTSLRELKCKNAFWIKISTVSLKMTCKIRNAFRIGI